VSLALDISVPGSRAAALRWTGEGHEVLVGRSSHAHLQLPDDRISGLHLAFRWEAGQGAYLVQDEGSLNGTRLQGRTLGHAPEPVQAGDRLELGRVLLVIREVSPPGEPPPTVLPLTSPSRELLQILERPAPVTTSDLGPPGSAPPLGGEHRERGLDPVDALLALTGLGATVLGLWLLGGG
jgi:pSer/pThr/pTyr-binding forkhead associated (FHA) protein